MSFDLKAKVCKEIGPGSETEIRFYYPDNNNRELVLFKVVINERTKIHDIITFCKRQLSSFPIKYSLICSNIEFYKSDFENFIRSFMKYLSDEDIFNYSGRIEFPWHYDAENFTYEYTLNPVILS